MSDDTTLVIERLFKASPDKLYEAWTNPDILQKWWGPVGVTIPDLSLDVNENGAWSTTMHSDQMGSRTVCGKYLVLEPPHRLVFTWGWVDEGKRGHETQIEVTLQQAGSDTLMKLTQTAFETIEDRNSHNSGWASSFVKLENSV